MEIIVNKGGGRLLGVRAWSGRCDMSVRIGLCDGYGRPKGKHWRVLRRGGLGVRSCGVQRSRERMLDSYIKNGEGYR